MIKNYLLIVITLFCFEFNFAQEATLCPIQKSRFTIENISDVPSSVDNSDGTITLTHPEQYITDVFANYVIYDFYQTYPTGSENAQKLYSIEFESRGLINELIDTITDDTFIFPSYIDGNLNYAETTIISPEIILALDGKTIEVIKWLSTSDADNCGPCPLWDVPEGFSFKITCSYDANNNTIEMESDGLSSCGNAFSIKLTGGDPIVSPNSDNILQLWESIPGTSGISSYTDSCHFLEEHIFSLLGIACINNNYGNIHISFDSETNNIQFSRPNYIFGGDTIEFSEANLSIEDNVFERIKPFKTTNNPFLQISNSDSQFLTVEIISITGQTILQDTTFETNTINLSNVSKGIYFIKLKTLSKQQKVFKFLNY